MLHVPDENQAAKEAADKVALWDKLEYVTGHHQSEVVAGASGTLYEAQLVAPDQWIITLDGPQRSALLVLSNVFPKLRSELWHVAYKRGTLGMIAT